MEFNDMMFLKYVSEDKELTTFFKKLTLYCDAFVSRVLEEVKKPSLDNIEEAIKRIEEAGIILDQESKEMWLNEEEYKDVYAEIKMIQTTKFSGNKLQYNDIYIFAERIKSIENGKPAPKRQTDSEDRYNTWCKYNNYDLIKKRYEKENKKYIKESKKNPSTKKSNKLLDLEVTLRYAEDLEEKAKFTKNMTYQQMVAIVDAVKEISLTVKAYKEYYKNPERKKECIDKYDLYKEAFVKMSEECLTEIDLNNIIKKLFIYCILAWTSNKKIPEIELDFENAIFWFLDFKKDKFKELCEKVFDLNNFSLAVDPICDKVLKK